MEKHLLRISLLIAVVVLGGCHGGSDPAAIETLVDDAGSGEDARCEKALAAVDGVDHAALRVRLNTKIEEVTTRMKGITGRPSAFAELNKLIDAGVCLAKLRAKLQTAE